MTHELLCPASSKIDALAHGYGLSPRPLLGPPPAEPKAPRPAPRGNAAERIGPMLWAWMAGRRQAC